MSDGGRDGTMRVLLVSLYHPELVRGGAQQVCHELFEGLRARADVTCFLLASIDEAYPKLFKSGACITGFDGRPNEFLFLSGEYDHWWHKLWEPRLIEAYVEFLLTIQPDVVHFHHFMTYGIDVISITRRTLPNCRILFTFHEFLAICVADGQMVRRTDRSLCDTQTNLRCHQCFPDRAPEEFFQRKMWFTRHLAQVDHFTCPSRFMIDRYVDWGIDRAKISHVGNGQRSRARDGREPAPPAVRNRFAYFGQLLDNKGVHIVLRAVDLLRADGFTDFRVEINGDNIRFASEAVRQEIETFLANERKRPPGRRLVIENGSYHPDQLHTRMARIDWCIVPSVWAEVFGLVVSEAWMFGKPVICSNVGGLAERVTDDVDGLHFEMGDPRALAAAILRACTEDGLWQRLHSQLPPPPPRDAMVEGYMALYGAPKPVKKRLKSKS